MSKRRLNHYIASSVAGLTAMLGGCAQLSAPMKSDSVKLTPLFAVENSAPVLFAGTPIAGKAPAELEKILTSKKLTHRDFLRFVIYAHHYHHATAPLPTEVIDAIQTASNKRLSDKEHEYISIGLGIIISTNAQVESMRAQVQDPLRGSEAKLRLATLVAAGANIADQPLLTLLANMPECVQIHGKKVMDGEFIRNATTDFGQDPAGFTRKNFGNSTGLFTIEEMQVVAAATALLIYNTAGIQPLTHDATGTLSQLPMAAEMTLTPLASAEKTVIVFAAVPNIEKGRAITASDYYMVITGKKDVLPLSPENTKVSTTEQHPTKIFCDMISSLSNITRQHTTLLSNAKPDNLDFLNPAIAALQQNIPAQTLANHRAR